MPLTAIDLFAGGGGLSVGLERAGFRVVAAVELDRAATDTYKLNHTETAVLQKDIRATTGQELLAAAGQTSIDLVAGCPPCQGFTSLTSKWRRDDDRNNLVLEMGRVVAEILPRAVMMENVPGLAGKGKVHLKEFVRLLESLGYKVEYNVLQVADFGTPQVRRRFVLMAGRGFKIRLPNRTHSKKHRQKSRRWATVRNVISGLEAPKPLPESELSDGSELRSWNVFRSMSEINLERLAWAKPGGDWRDIPEHLRPPCHRGDYFGFRNVYGRMTWDDPAPTITAGCTSFSKGRFGHPEEKRTISVREAGLLQQFPEEYRFASSSIDDACSIIGNALPCGFAEKMASQVAARLVKGPRSEIMTPVV